MIRRLVNKMTTREQLLLAVVGWVLLIIAANLLIREGQALHRQWQQTSGEIHNQEVILKQQERVETALEAKQAEFDETRTFSLPEMVQTADELARSSDIRPQSFNTDTTESQLFDLHTLVFRTGVTQIENLIALEARLRAESPYISVERVTIRRRSERQPKQLQSSFQVSSFERNEISATSATENP